MPEIPAVNRAFEYRGESILVPPARPGVTYPYESEGGKATVVRVQRNTEQLALKVFKHAYRTEKQLESARRLSDMKHLPGLYAARQEVIQPSDEAATSWPDLRWAAIMPWVAGSTWGEFLESVGSGDLTFTRAEALAVAVSILSILKPLEEKGIVHCDLSSGNLMLSSRGDDVQLVDLEDMYIAGSAMGPASFTSGSQGYRLPGVDRTACPEGDRYAAAILIAEALSLASPYVRDLATTEGVFSGNRENAKAQQRFDAIYFDLNQWQPRFAELFRTAWSASSLKDCAPVSALLESVSAPQQKPAKARADQGTKSKIFGDGNTGLPPLITREAVQAEAPKPPAREKRFDGSAAQNTTVIPPNTTPAQVTLPAPVPAGVRACPKCSATDLTRVHDWSPVGEATIAFFVYLGIAFGLAHWADAILAHPDPYPHVVVTLLQNYGVTAANIVRGLFGIGALTVIGMFFKALFGDKRCKLCGHTW